MVDRLYHRRGAVQFGHELRLSRSAAVLSGCSNTEHPPLRSLVLEADFASQSPLLCRDREDPIIKIMSNRDRMSVQDRGQP